MQVKMYSPTAPCSNCWATEKRFNKNATAFEKIEIDPADESARQQLRELGLRSPQQKEFAAFPVVAIEDDNGELIDAWAGFMVTKIDALKEEKDET